MGNLFPQYVHCTVVIRYYCTVIIYRQCKVLITKMIKDDIYISQHGHIILFCIKISYILILLFNGHSMYKVACTEFNDQYNNNFIYFMYKILQAKAKNLKLATILCTV